ncbi:hypothetical protein DSO57_1029780 [Entomophthora muscae]|uniref:Uncharacterized protein n=1 Tax=Entomophthora muscae TaxID=34485 RepID=A0ACC2TN48_9FUNG|nr:hypothetical protein DSO57_1029780 [Entomophthora muscae]
MSYSKLKFTRVPTSVFLFRHQTTGQVVPSRKDSLEITTVWQHLRSPPTALRKDQWKPIIAVSGFPSDTTADIVWQSLMTYPEAIQNEEFKSLPKRLRVPIVKDQTQHKISALCRIISDLPNYLDDSRVFPIKPEGPLSLNLLCETPFFRELVEKDELKWPDFVKHEELVLLRGRNIMNPEYRKTTTAAEHREKIGNQIDI